MSTRHSKRGIRTLRRSAREIPRALSPLLTIFALSCARAAPQELGYTRDSLESSEDDIDVTPRDFFGEWIGTAEDALALADDPAVYRFPSGSTQIRLNLIDYGSATLTFGEGSPPEGPIDPGSAYPPGLTFEEYEPHPVPLEGFDYPLYDYVFQTESIRDSTGALEIGPDVTLEPADGIWRFQYSARDALAPWCAEQRTRDDGHGGWNCLGAMGVERALDDFCYTFDSLADFYPIGSRDGSGVIPDPARQVDCVRAFQCFDQCLCPSPGIGGDANETPCLVNSEPNMNELWLRRTDEGLVGVFTGRAVFQNARGARTSLGRVRFVPADD